LRGDAHVFEGSGGTQSSIRSLKYSSTKSPSPSILLTAFQSPADIRPNFMTIRHLFGHPMHRFHAIIERIVKSCNDGTNGSRQFATSAEVSELTQLATELMSKEPAVLNLVGDFVVVGDIHGDIKTLVRIFDHMGYPDCRRYLFLGDYVDRGSSSCEVIVLLYILKLEFSNNIYLLRGNHEFGSMTLNYGFGHECRRRFVSDVYDSIISSFSTLPIAATINHKIFCVHGGISPRSVHCDDDLNHRNRFIESIHKAGDSCDFEVCDLLWSDPRRYVEGFVSSERGSGHFFGSDVFERFLELNGFSLLVRSHEMCSDGFDWPFGQRSKLLTIFSCVDYCGLRNDGGILVISNDDGEGVDISIEIETFRFDKSISPSRYLIPEFILRSTSSSISRELLCGLTVVAANMLHRIAFL
jgi:serine/threonine-protein phosphatase PP1 catalytic subunit